MIENSAASIERRRRAFDLLREALDVDEPARRAWIAQRAGDDGDLADDVNALLGASGAHLLDHGADTLAARLAAEETGEDVPAGSRIGAWTVVGLVGSGGMGTVYRVERDGDGYVHSGALKRIKRGMDSDAVLARFRRERQILSRLAHPAIARPSAATPPSSSRAIAGCARRERICRSRRKRASTASESMPRLMRLSAPLCT